MRQEDLDRCGALLAQGRGFWEAQGRPAPESGWESVPRLVLDRLEGERGVCLAAACQSFLLFRLLHREGRTGAPEAVLLGDYFFGLFSRCLIPLDSTWLIERFSGFLREDAEAGVRQEPFSLPAYRDFVEAVSGRMALC